MHGTFRGTVYSLSGTLVRRRLGQCNCKVPPGRHWIYLNAIYLVLRSSLSSGSEVWMMRFRSRQPTTLYLGLDPTLIRRCTLIQWISPQRWVTAGCYMWPTFDWRRNTCWPWPGPSVAYNLSASNTLQNLGILRQKTHEVERSSRHKPPGPRP